MAFLPIRTYGDPVLRTRAKEVTQVDSALVALTVDMVDTMEQAPGVGLAAPQVGVEKRLFVYDVGHGPHTMINPEIRESSGEWVYEEGCLSVPELFWPITRPKDVLICGQDLEGNAIEIEATELLARVFQHELDHLNGVLLIERLDDEQRKAAKKLLRKALIAGGGMMRRDDD